MASGNICLTASASYVKFTGSLNAVTGKSSASGESRELPAGERQHQRRVNWPLSSCPKGGCRKAPGVGTDGLARRYREMRACSYCCVKQSGTAQKAFGPASLAEEPGMQGFLFNTKLRFLLNKNAPQGGALRRQNTLYAYRFRRKENGVTLQSRCHRKEVAGKLGKESHQR